MLEIIKGVEKVSGLKVPHEFAPRRPGDPDALYANSEKAKRELGWKIKYTNVEDIIATAWAWHSKHPDGFGDKK